MAEGYTARPDGMAVESAPKIRRFFHKQEGEMKTRTALVFLVVFLAGLGLALAQTDVTMQMGTWKLNEGKSKFAAGATKNTTVVYSGMGDQIKCVTDGVDKDGKPTHTEWTGKFDGKDYPV